MTIEQQVKKINANKDYHHKIYFVVMIVQKYIYNKSWSLEGLIFQKIIIGKSNHGTYNN